MRRIYPMIRVTDLTITRGAAFRILRPLSASRVSAVSVCRSLWRFDVQGLSFVLRRHYGLGPEIGVDLAIDISWFVYRLNEVGREVFLKNLCDCHDWNSADSEMDQQKFWSSVF